jgi:hypothetical protein
VLVAQSLRDEFTRGVLKTEERYEIPRSFDPERPAGLVIGGEGSRHAVRGYTRPASQPRH